MSFIYTLQLICCRSQLEFGNLYKKLDRWMWLGEDVSFLSCSGNRNKSECLLDQMMTNKVIVDLNMFCVFVKYIMMSYLNSTLIITLNGSVKMMRNNHIYLEGVIVTATVQMLHLQELNIQPRYWSGRQQFTSYCAKR